MYILDRQACLLALILLLGSVSSSAAELLVPAYFYPGGKTNYWTKLTGSASTVRLTAILNPASGPGSSVDSNYATAVAQLRAAGGLVIAYVPTTYGNRTLSDVVADINRYTSFYAVDGFFIDEMTNDSTTAHVQYYQSIYNYVKGLNSRYTVVGNPGTNTQEIYLSLPTADKLVVFESGFSSYAAYAPAAWQANYSADHFVHMVYGASKAQLGKVLQGAASRRAGNLFITSDMLPNPYDTLPSYWSDEASGVAALH
jgi:hypothetical protein